MRLLDAGGFEIVEDHRGEVLILAVPATGFGDAVDELVVLVDGERAVRRQALHGEGAGDADFLVVFVGLVVEVFVVGFGGDGGIDLLLSDDALFPPIHVNSSDLLGPSLVGGAGDFPFLVRCAERGVQFPAQRLQPFLELLPNDIDFGIVGDGLERDVGDALVDEALANVVVGGHFRVGLAGNLGFLGLAVAAVGEQIVGIAGAHDAGAGER